MIPVRNMPGGYWRILLWQRWTYQLMRCDDGRYIWVEANHANKRGQFETREEAEKVLDQTKQAFEQGDTMAGPPNHWEYKDPFARVFIEQWSC